MEKELENKNIKEARFDLEAQILRLENKLEQLGKSSTAQIEEEKRKYNKMHTVCMGLHTREDDLKKELAVNKKAHEETSKRVSFMTTKFTEANFAKTEIENKYSDMLFLHQKEKNHEREMMIELVTTKDKLSEEECNHQKALRAHQKQVERLEAVIAKLRQQLKEAD